MINSVGWGRGDGWMLWKIYGPEKEYYTHTHTHTHTHTKHRAKNLGAFVDHLEKIIILTSSCLSVCLFAWNIPNPNKRIFQFIFGALTTLRRLMILVKM